jgi:hypothetical protein
VRPADDRRLPEEDCNRFVAAFPHRPQTLVEQHKPAVIHELRQAPTFIRAATPKLAPVTVNPVRLIFNSRRN